MIQLNFSGIYSTHQFPLSINTTKLKYLMVHINTYMKQYDLALLDFEKKLLTKYENFGSWQMTTVQFI